MARFSKILILSDDADSSITVAENVFEIWGNPDTLIHLGRLLYKNAILVKMSNMFRGISNHSASAARKWNRQYLNRLKNRLRSVDESIEIVSNTMNRKTGSKYLRKYISENKIDLIVVADPENGNRKQQFLETYYTRLSGKTGVPIVFFFKKTAPYHNRLVLLPVYDTVPEKALAVALDLARYYGGQIHMVNIMKNEPDKKQQSDAFYQTYKILSESGYAPQYKILSGKEKHAELYAYAKQARATMMLIGGDPQPGFSALLKCRLQNILYPVSGLQVLTIKQSLFNAYKMTI